MKSLRPLIAIATISNLLTLLLYAYAASQPGGTGIAMLFILVWMPLLWLITIISSIIFVTIKRKSTLKKNVLKWTILVFLFCTPLPIYLLFYLTNNKKTYMVASGYNTKNGKVYKREEWEYYKSLHTYVNKYYIADSIQESQAEAHGQEAFKKDSIWIYFKENGDTLKVERYRNDTLLLKKNTKNKTSNHKS